MERNATVDQEAVTSQVQLILSRDLARDVIRSSSSAKSRNSIRCCAALR